jgi:hypothetical protein
MKGKIEPKIKPVAQKKVPKATTSEATPRPKNTVVLASKPVGVLPIAVELLDEPLEAAEVVRVKVKKITVNDTIFWKDCENNLYQLNKDNGVGKREGIWNEGEDEEKHEPDFLGTSEDD